MTAVARATLNALLPRHYVADIGERVYIVQPERSIYPDVVIIEHPSVRPQGSRLAQHQRRWSATLLGGHLSSGGDAGVFIEILPVGDEAG